MLSSVVVLLPTTYENNLVSIFCEWLIALIHTPCTYSHQGQTFIAINHDDFATGFEECTSTFSQEKRALNPVKIVVMEVLVYYMCRGGGGGGSHMPELSRP